MRRHPDCLRSGKRQSHWPLFGFGDGKGHAKRKIGVNKTMRITYAQPTISGKLLDMMRVVGNSANWLQNVRSGTRISSSELSSPSSATRTLPDSRLVTGSILSDGDANTDDVVISPE